MGKAKKKISILTLVLSLCVVSVNSSFDCNAFSKWNLCASVEFQNSSDLIEYSHTNCCEDESFMSDSKMESNIETTAKEMTPGFQGNIDNNNLNNIWQPPELS